MSRTVEKKLPVIDGSDFIKQQDVPAEFFCNCGRTTFWNIRRQPGFPRPRRVSGGLILYRRSELIDFIDGCAT